MADTVERLATLETEIKVHRWLGPALLLGLGILFGVSLKSAKSDAIKSLKEEIQTDTLGQAREAAIQAAKDADVAKAGAQKALTEANRALSEARTDAVRIVTKSGLQGIAQGSSHVLLTVPPSSRGLAIIYVKQRVSEGTLEELGIDKALLRNILSISQSYLVHFDGSVRFNGIDTKEAKDAAGMSFRTSFHDDTGVLICDLKEDESMTGGKILFDFNLLLFCLS